MAMAETGRLGTLLLPPPPPAAGRLPAAGLLLPHRFGVGELVEGGAPVVGAHAGVAHAPEGQMRVQVLEHGVVHTG
eukprot:COSAG01_NODE_8856_length_2636_cov_3.298384_4_plen_76_part_00